MTSWHIPPLPPTWTFKVHGLILFAVRRNKKAITLWMCWREERRWHSCRRGLFLIKYLSFCLLCPEIKMIFRGVVKTRNWPWGQRGKMFPWWRQREGKKCLGDSPGGTVVKNPPANAGDTGSSPGPGRSHMAWSDWAHKPQLLSLRSRAHEPQLLSPHAATTEAHAPRARAPQQEKPPQWEAHAPQQRVAPTRRS